MFRKKKWIIICTSFCLILLTALCLCADISGAPLEAGGAVCISFDRWDMLRADKVVIRFHEETHTITDTEFVRAFSKETLSGTHSEYCCSNLDDGWVEIYRGDRLLRHMRFISNHDAFAYEADITHWVLFGKEGHAFLSVDLRQRLLEIIST